MVDFAPAVATELKTDMGTLVTVVASFEVATSPLLGPLPCRVFRPTITRTTATTTAPTSTGSVTSIVGKTTVSSRGIRSRRGMAAFR